ncbi:DUF4214 domain-containing protein [Undibacterium flavidum]|uniref:DUF4214 domain-containing protein n=1 Tax=Undibacterium flavidum TaxID=2762297 RepID=A0ABR6YB75_9BURK|nr:DUF4214 domain-containing protein [Undibacterium flavidum]MBC3873487.1 DUF4214 domain-containing protein [Undibacterium flavidum]
MKNFQEILRLFATMLVVLFLNACGGGSVEQKENSASTMAYSPVPINTSMTFLGPRSDYVIWQKSGITYIQDMVGNAGLLDISHVDRLIFSDVIITANMNQSVNSISKKDYQNLVELYIAFFNRVPDADGLSYWITQIKNGMTLDQLADNFYNAALQYSELTGFTLAMTNDTFVRIIYKNVLGRSGTSAPPDADVKYWVDQLVSGKTKGYLVVTMLNSAHTFKGDKLFGWVADLLDNKFIVGDYIANIKGISFNSPQVAIKQSMEIASAVTPTDVLVATKKASAYATNTRSLIVSNAGDSQIVPVDAIVTLKGAATSKLVQSNFIYLWAIVSKPTNSKATLSSVPALTVSFTPDLVGEYLVSLVASDGINSSLPSIVTITANQIEVVVNPIPDSGVYSCSSISYEWARLLYSQGHTYLDRDHDGKPCEANDKALEHPITPSTNKQCYVNGYFRKNGTYVHGYYRSC